ncbi:L,D-transpeptidase family protein [Streptomyces axinellae]|uniref:L,D-transpeptidase family protein n=1 Tax=Streptomyces axinellae TaxID=552788 RepID=A0ABP6D4Z2_9ACTN
MLGTQARGAAARKGVAAAAVVLLGAGAVAGCQPGTGTSADGKPIRISKIPQQAPTGPPQSSSAPPSPHTSAPPRPAYTPPRPASPRPAAQTVRMAPGNQGEHVRELQARLRQLGLFNRNPTGYYGSVTAASVSAFQAQRGLTRTGKVTDPLLSALRSRTHNPAHTELYPPTSRPAGKPDPRCLTGRTLCVSKKSRTLRWMVDGQVRAAMDVRFGSAYTPTREGTFKVDFKSRHHRSTIYDSPMPYAMFFSGGQAVHYSSDFAARGYAGASHGCVNVRDKTKLAKVFAQVRPGDKVVVYK